MLRLGVRVRREHAELVLVELLALAPGGVEEVSIGDDVVEYAVYGAPGELPALPDLRAAAGAALVDVATEEIADDWAERWRQFHKPLVLDGRLTVRPPWEPPGNTPIDLVIDPGRAFGTGAHATTRLCLELMLELEQQDDLGAAQPDDSGAAHSGEAGCRARGKPEGEAGRRAGGRPKGAFVDLGCGSGVLAIAAARLGWAPVVALDNDPASIDAARVNAQVNAVDVDVRRHDLRVAPVPPARTIAANLLAPLLLAWARRLPQEPGLPEHVIASGLLTHESDHVAKVFAERGLIESEQRIAGEWAALLLARRRRG